MPNTHRPHYLSGFSLTGRPATVTLNYGECLRNGCHHKPQQIAPAALDRAMPRSRWFVSHNRLRLTCPAGHRIKERWWVGKNQFLTVALSNILGLIHGSASTFALKPLYFAFGTSTAATTNSTTGLTAEAGRVICALYRGGQVGSYYLQEIATAFLGPDDGNFNLQEFALMAGAATATINTGTAIARFLHNQGNKTNAETITVVWTITGAGV